MPSSLALEPSLDLETLSFFSSDCIMSIYFDYFQKITNRTAQETDWSRWFTRARSFNHLFQSNFVCRIIPLDATLQDPPSCCLHGSTDNMPFLWLYVNTSCHNWNYKNKAEFFWLQKLKWLGISRTCGSVGYWRFNERWPHPRRRRRCHKNNDRSGWLL